MTRRMFNTSGHMGVGTSSEGLPAQQRLRPGLQILNPGALNPGAWLAKAAAGQKKALADPCPCRLKVLPGAMTAQFLPALHCQRAAAPLLRYLQLP